VKTLGYGAVEFLLSPSEQQATLDGALVCVIEGRLNYLPFEELIDPKTGRTRVRLVDVTKPTYRVAREYMIRLEREDFEDGQTLARLAQAASTKQKQVTPEEFKAQFLPVVTTLSGGV
jgi:6-phosphofructokinase 1